ncbi:MAG TPA: formyltransferase family protein [Gaiellaceae bacterium]|jgi:methionyl-tRNA formyltransferase|nr:formyltransferase family protein [Gaiellaceae bacterium]
MSATPWRVVIITVLPVVARLSAQIVQGLGHEPVAVITPRRRAAGAPPMPFAAEHVDTDPHELDVLFPATRDSIAPLLRAYEPDLALCGGFPWRIPAEAIAVPKHGIVNGHPSLLPRYRGPFPVAWAVRNGETEIGLTYHLMDAEFDTGNVLAQAPIELRHDDTHETLFARFPDVTAELLPIVFERLGRGDRGEVQEGGEYQSGFEDDYRFIDLTQTAEEVHRQTRAWGFMPPILPDPGPILERDGTRLRLLRTSLTEVAGAERIDCADAPLWILETADA